MKSLSLKAWFLAVALLICTSAQAATFVVTQTDDPAPAPAPNGCNTGGNCSLREAVLAANALPDPDTIQLDATTYNLTITEAGSPETGDLDVLFSITFQGAGQTTTIINGVQPSLGDRIVEISGAGANVEISDLTIQGGIVSGDGGGILNTGSTNPLTLVNCQVLTNQALGGGSGGGINSDSDLSIENCIIKGNTVNDGNGGGIYFSSSGGMTITNSLVNNNSISNGSSGPSGGGIYFSAAGSLIADHTQINGNSIANTSGVGGGIYFSAAGGLTFTNGQINQNRLLNGGDGGGIYFSASGALDVENSQVNQNQVFAPGGDGGGILFGSSSSMNLSNTTLNENSLDSGDGAGINGSGATLNLETVQLINNAIPNGGTGAGGFLTGSGIFIANSTISGNHIDTTSGAGGGLFVGALDVVVQGSTFDNNFTFGDGGGLFLSAGTAEITNSTLTLNQANGDGGGIHFSTGPFSLNNVTLVQNQADADSTGGGGGGGVFDSGGVSPLTLRNTILSQNMDDSTGPDCSATAVTSAGYNIIGTNTGCTITPPQGDPASTDLYGVNPTLGPLQNNGGPTDTMALLAGSAALEGGDPTGCTDGVGTILDTDQRGQTRPAGVNCDIGAFELGSVDLEVTKTADASFYVVGDTITYTITVINNGPDTAFNVLLSDVLPGEVGFNSVDVQGDAECGESAGSVTCQAAQMAPGDQFVVTIVVSANEANDTVSNTAEVENTENDTDPDNNSSTANISITLNPVITGGGCGCHVGSTVPVNPILAIAFAGLALAGLAFRRKIAK